MLSRRAALPKEVQEEAGRLICAGFLERYSGYETYLLYLDMKNEVPVRSLVDALSGSGKSVYLPVMRGDMLLAGRYTGFDDLVFGRFGVLEPADAEDSVVFDVIVAPGVAFDRNCMRMGFGKGYYDRFLAQCRPKHLVGFAYEMQIVETVFPEAHDIPMDEVLTEKGRYRRN